MNYSIIIPAYNAETTIVLCLEAVLAQSLPRSQYEVIVVDDGSTDATSKIIRNFPVLYIHQENQGPAAARNKGAQIATGNIILFTDADCVPDHYWLEEMVSPFSGPEKISGVKGAYKTAQHALTARFAQAEFEDRFTLLEKASFIDMVDTYSAAFKRDVFCSIGGFDPSFPVANNEDTELSYRLVASGHLLVFNPRAFVYHTHPDTLKKYLRVKFWRGYWRVIVYARYPEKAIKDSYTPGVIKIQTLIMLLLYSLLPVCFFSRLVLMVLTPMLLTVLLLTTIPFSRSAFKKDKCVGCFSPVYCLLRAGVFAAGSMGACVSVVINKISHRFESSTWLNRD